MLPRLRKPLAGNHGLDAVIVTRGGHGAVVVDGDGTCVAAPPGEVQIVDTVGAGDAFSAVFILGLANGWPTDLTLERAIEFAAACLHGARRHHQDPPDCTLSSKTRDGGERWPRVKVFL